MDIQVKRLYRHRHLQFLAEWLLLTVLGAAVYYAMVFFAMERILPEYRSGYVHRQWLQFWVLAAIGSILLVIIYYGTSYATTPFSLFLPFLRRLFSFSSSRREMAKVDKLRWRHLPAPKTPTAEELMDKAAEAEFEEISASDKGLEEDEVVARVLRTSAVSAAKLAAKMERRINTHLIFGVLVGGAGLAVWWMSFYYGSLTNRPSDVTHYLMEAIPRITILLFIELLAGSSIPDRSRGPEVFPGARAPRRSQADCLCGVCQPGRR